MFLLGSSNLPAPNLALPVPKMGKRTLKESASPRGGGCAKRGLEPGKPRGRLRSYGTGVRSSSPAQQAGSPAPRAPGPAQPRATPGVPAPEEPRRAGRGGARGRGEGRARRGGHFRGGAR